MRGQPDDSTVLGRLLPGEDRWSDAATASLPPPWQPLAELDDRTLLDETARPPEAVAHDIAPSAAADGASSLLADVVDRHLASLGEAGRFSDTPDLAIDVSDVAPDPFGDDPLGDLAISGAGGSDTQGAPASLADPFFDADRPPADAPDDDVAQVVLGVGEAADSIGGFAAGDGADVGVDDITGREPSEPTVLDRPLRVEHHDPFDDAASDLPPGADHESEASSLADRGGLDAGSVDLTTDPVDGRPGDWFAGDDDLDVADDELDDQFGDDA